MKIKKEKRRKGDEISEKHEKRRVEKKQTKKILEIRRKIQGKRKKKKEEIKMVNTYPSIAPFDSSLAPYIVAVTNKRQISRFSLSKDDDLSKKMKRDTQTHRHIDTHAHRQTHR